MKRNRTLIVALAAMALATSCSQEDLTSQSKFSNNEISFNTTMGLKSRATETTTANLSSIYVSAYISSKDNYMSQVKYTKGTESKWSTDAGKFFWPASETLNFFAYAPEIKTDSDNKGTVTISKDKQEVADFTPYVKTDGDTKADAASQVDFIYATATGSASATEDGANNSTNGVTLKFNHALSQIVVKAKNENAAYQVKVTGVKIGGVKGKGTFTFSPSEGAANWASNETANTVYTTEYTNAVMLTSDAANVDNSQSFMLVPQQLTKSSDNKASAGSYLALKVTITMKSADNTYEGQEYYNGYAYVALDTNWEMGKKYTYIVDFSKGAGQDKDGNNIFGDEIKISTVTVDDWTTTTDSTVPES